MSDWQGGDVAVNGIRMHYTRTGGAKPPLVLAHGFSDDGLCWTPVAQALAADYDVVMVDARGHGRSEAPAHGYGAAEQAADLAGVIAAVGLHKPPILGHSMGAATALVLAGTYPDVPGAVLLEDPPARWMPAPPPPPADPAATPRPAPTTDWITRLKTKTREELIADQRAETPHWSDAELGPWADSKLRFNLNARNREGVAPVDWPATARRITCPALLITGDASHGAIVKEEDAATLRSLVPQLKVAYIAGAGHSIRRDRFDDYLAVVRVFLRGVAMAGSAAN
jgi:pimeloyl-ACP methyl ester carboxylesterase